MTGGRERGSIYPTISAVISRVRSNSEGLGGIEFGKLALIQRVDGPGLSSCPRIISVERSVQRKNDTCLGVYQNLKYYLIIFSRKFLYS